MWGEGSLSQLPKRGRWLYRYPWVCLWGSGRAEAAVDREGRSSGHCRPMEGTRAFLIPG